MWVMHEEVASGIVVSNIMAYINMRHSKKCYKTFSFTYELVPDRFSFFITILTHLGLFKLIYGPLTLFTLIQVYLDSMQLI